MTNLRVTDRAKNDLDSLKADPSQEKRYKKVLKTLALLQTNRRHPSLNVHKLSSIPHYLASGEKVDVWEAYVENNTPRAWRVLFHLGERDVVTVITVREHL